MQWYINLIFQKGKGVLNNQREYDHEFRLAFCRLQNPPLLMQNIFLLLLEGAQNLEPYLLFLNQTFLFVMGIHIRRPEKINNYNRSFLKSHIHRASFPKRPRKEWRRQILY